MKDLTLVTVNWNAIDAMSLMLKSYVKYHYNGEPLNLLLVDNGSSDGSKEWLRENEVPFVDFQDNCGHEESLNRIYKDIKTQYVLLVDTDIEFYDDVYWYLSFLYGDCISAGELIDKNYIGAHKIKDRISPWFWLFDYAAMRRCGVDTFRTKEDWVFDVGSEYYMWMQELGYTNHHIGRLNAVENQDHDLISMKYPRYIHWGKISWDINEKHPDRYSEVIRRRYAIKERLKEYNNIHIKGKFVIQH